MHYCGGTWPTHPKYRSRIVIVKNKMLIEDDHSSRSTMLMIFLKKSFTNYNSIDIDYIKWWAREIRREVINKDKVKN
jgi:hypothetical protein